MHDPVLGHAWLVTANCDHPERPALMSSAADAPAKLASAAPQPVSRAASTAPVIRAGDSVRLWRQENMLRIEVAGVSEESGELGKTIHVRLVLRNVEDQAAQQQRVLGVVRGASNVEMLP